MNTKVKYLLGGIIFILCVCVGYFATESWGGYSETNELKQTEAPSKKPVVLNDKSQGSLGSSNTIVTPANPDSTKGNPTVPVVQKPSEPLKIASTKVLKTGDTYSLQIICANIPENIILGYEIPALHKKNSNGYFTQIPGCKSGSYKVIVVNSTTGEELASKMVDGFKLSEEKPVEKMSSGEFQTLLLNQGDNSLLGGKHPKVAKSVALSFEGLHDGEKKPGDILAVREKIAYGIWSSAKVLRVGYDDKGKINSARIQPVY